MTDRLDTELARLRDELRATASRSAGANEALRAAKGVEPGTRAAIRRDARRGRAIAVASTLLLAAASVIAIVATRGDDRKVTVPATDGPQTSLVSTTTPTSASDTASTTPAAGTPISDVSAVSFIDAQQGYAFVLDGTVNAAVFATSDGGATWQQTGRIDGAGLDGHLTFADTTNGWFASPNGVWSTHDGGRTWHSVSAPELWTADGGPTPFVADHGKVYAVGRSDRPDGGFVLYSSSVTVDAFQPTGISFQQGAGPVSEFSMAAADGSVWAVYNDRVCGGGGRIEGDAIGTDWTPPACDQGGAVRVTAAHDGGPVYASSLTGVWTDVKLANVAFVSVDGGTTFQPVDLPPNAHGDQHPDNVEIVPIDSRTVGAVVSAADGSSAELFRSGDRGTTWTKVAPVDVADIRFIDSTTAVASKVSPDGSGHVERSGDGGVTWTPIGTPPPINTSTSDTPPRISGIVDAQFVDATHGWVLGRVGDGPGFQLLATDDGHSWHRVVAPLTDPIGFFALDATTLWMWDGGAVVVTYDSGVTFTRVAGAPSVGEGGNPVLVASGTVYIAGSTSDHIVVTSGRVGENVVEPTGIEFSWGAGPLQEISLAHQGTTVFVVYNDRGPVGSARIVDGRVDTKWKPPVGDGLGNVFLTAAPDGDTLYVYSENGFWGNGPAKDVAFASTDGGNHFHSIGLPSLPPGTVLHAVGPTTLSAFQGSTVFISDDRGASFRGVPAPPFATADPSVTVTISFSATGLATAVVNGADTTSLWISRGGGISWTQVPTAP
jgi:hypothetical protein